MAHADVQLVLVRVLHVVGVLLSVVRDDGAAIPSVRSIDENFKHGNRQGLTACISVCCCLSAQLRRCPHHRRPPMLQASKALCTASAQAVSSCGTPAHLRPEVFDAPADELRLRRQSGKVGVRLLLGGPLPLQVPVLRAQPQPLLRTLPARGSRVPPDVMRLCKPRLKLDSVSTPATVLNT